MTTNPGGRDSEELEKGEQRLSLDTEASEKLTVSREEIIKGVVIKGIVSTPKAGHKKKDRSKTVSTSSLNPFEKRKAPNPPPAPPPSDSVPKTKASKKRGMSVI